MIALIDARSDSLTVTWPTVAGAKRYILEIKTSDDDDNFRELSSKLTQTQAKKKNLVPNKEYFFRVTPVMDDETSGGWTSHKEAFRTLPENSTTIEAPTTLPSGNRALMVQWKSHDATKFELQMRENKGGEGWTTIAAAFAGSQVRKKNLTSDFGYQFRVRPIGPNHWFSPPSEARVAPGFSQALRERWFGSGTKTLLRSGISQPVPLADALGGKEFVLFYVSAHWCPPCRKFTPMLANWYKTTKTVVEVVFVSADHDEEGFRTYFSSSHPWTAIEYEDSARETLMSLLQVQGIPRLVVIDAATGNIVENNAVGKPLDLNQWRRAAKQQRH